MKLLALLLSTVFVLALADDPYVRLDGSSDDKSGRVKVSVNKDGNFEQVCSDGFTETDAKVVCNSLGFDSDGSVENGKYGVDNSGLGLKALGCTGNEASILDCPYNKHPGYCTSIAAVDCNPPEVGTTGTIGLEAGIIAAIIICVATLISVGIGLGVCLYRNDLCPFCQKTPGGEV